MHKNISYSIFVLIGVVFAFSFSGCGKLHGIDGEDHYNPVSEHFNIVNNSPEMLALSPNEMFIEPGEYDRFYLKIRNPLIDEINVGGITANEDGVEFFDNLKLVRNNIVGDCDMTFYIPPINIRYNQQFVDSYSVYVPRSCDEGDITRFILTFDAGDDNKHKKEINIEVK